MEYTPGPWTAVQDPESLSWGVEVDDQFLLLTEDNARLIAAAPRLYEALDDLLRFVERYQYLPRADARLTNAQTAIAKAKGE